MNLKAVIAELIGTFCFVLIGVASVAVSAMQGSSLGQIGPAIAHGLALAVVISATMHISGGMINPAVTIAVWLANKVSFIQAIANIVAQCVGAIAAVSVLNTCLGKDILEAVNWGTPSLGNGVGQYAGMTLEAILTFVLVLAVLGTAVDARAPRMGGIYVGFTVVAAALSIGPLTGAGLNPARYIGPAVIAADWQNLIVYIAGPILGGAVAALIYTYGIGKETALLDVKEA